MRKNATDVLSAIAHANFNKMAPAFHDLSRTGHLSKLFRVRFQPLFAYRNRNGMNGNFPQSHNFALATHVRIALIVLVFTNIFLTTGCGWDKPNTHLLSLLDRALTDVRPSEARLTGEPYRPWIQARGITETHAETPAFRLAEIEILKAATENETPETLLALGRLYLAKGQHKKATETLDKAAAISTDNAKLLADLGAAYLSSISGRPETGKELRSWAIAIELLDRSAQIDPSLVEPKFNRAISLSRLGLYATAITALEDYLVTDSSSGWADEVRRRHAEIESRNYSNVTPSELFDEFLDAYRAGNEEVAFKRLSENREMITGKLVFQQLAFQFADSDHGTERSTEMLKAMRFAADLEIKKTGDRFWTDWAAHYERSGVKNHSKLKPAQDLVRSAYAKMISNDNPAAMKEVLKAKAIFDEVGSKNEAFLLEYWIGYLDHQAGRLQEATERLTAASEKAEKLEYFWLNSHFKGWLSQVEYFNDNTARRIELDKRALTLAEKTFDDFQRKRLSDSLELSFLHLGMAESSLGYLAGSLKLTSLKYGSDRQHHRALVQGAMMLAKLNYYTAAHYLLREAVEWNNSRVFDKSFVYWTMFLLGQTEAARANYELSLEYFKRASDSIVYLSEDTRGRHQSYLELLSAHTLREAGRCDEAVPLYERVRQSLENSESVLDRFDNRRGLLYCRLDLGQNTEAQTETIEILGLLDRYRSLIRSESAGNSFFASVQDVYDRLIADKVIKGDSFGALRYSELSRSRSLLDLTQNPSTIKTDLAEPDVTLGNDFSNPLDNSELLARLPKDSQLLIYNVLEKRLAITLLTNAGLRTVTSELSDKELGLITMRFLSSISTPGKFEEDRGSSAKRLNEVIFEPVRTLIDPSRPITIVPDKMLNRVPFGALVAGDGAFLAERFEFQMAPSVSLFILANEEADRRKIKEDERILVIGDPEFDRNEFPEYPRLESAQTEAENIRAIYEPTSRTLVGSDATIRNVAGEMGEATVFHFAGHYHFDPISPLNSGLLLAGKGRTSILTNSDLVGIRLSRMRLAVLSACTTGSEKVVDAEGMIGAARMFLANGVPQVVASHWEIDSAVSSRLMLSFHKNRKLQNMSTSAALRAAQLELINNPDQTTRDPYYWAAFFVLGGN